MKDKNSLIEENYSFGNTWMPGSFVAKHTLQLFLFLKVLCVYSE